MGEGLEDRNSGLGKEIVCHLCPAIPMSAARGHRRSVFMAFWRVELLGEGRKGKRTPQDLLA